MFESTYIKFKNDRELWEYLINGGIIAYKSNKNFKINLVDGKKCWPDGSSAEGCLLYHNLWVGIRNGMYQIVNEKEARTLNLYPVNDEVLTTQEYVFYLIQEEHFSVDVALDKDDWVEALKTATEATILEVEKYLNRLIEARGLLSLIKEN